MVWFRRNALRRAGLRKTRLTTTVGEQIVWHGGAGPVLVLLHGAGHEAGGWCKVVPGMKRHFQLVLPVFAGHGEHDPVAGVLSLGTLLTALEQVLEATPWRDAPLVLAGTRSGPGWHALCPEIPAAGDAGCTHRRRPHRERIGDRPHAQEPRRGSACVRCRARSLLRGRRISSSMIWFASRIEVRFRGCWPQALKTYRNTCSKANLQPSNCRSISSGAPPIASSHSTMRRNCNRSFRTARLQSLSVAAMRRNSSVPTNSRKSCCKHSHQIRPARPRSRKLFPDHRGRTRDRYHWRHSRRARPS